MAIRAKVFRQNLAGDGHCLGCGGAFVLLFAWNQMGDAQEGFVFGISFAEVAVMLGAILPTEIALRQCFDEDGKSRN
ncbi:hypothetical protein QO008_000662 [Peptoniphilus ivorii]|nr:hypothetical protein [Peptoniphilus ivorii]MDQ0508213.1 hypothetical protein [Peptoniphilus ivorii]